MAAERGPARAPALVPPPSGGRLSLALRRRDEARRVLARLLRDRRLIEARSAAAGRTDPLKSLTGASALDRAVASTHEVIRRIDDVLRELRGELEAEDAAPLPPLVPPRAEPVPVAASP